MAHAIFTQNENSKYDDQLGVAYHIPSVYLTRVQQTLNDLVILCQCGRSGGYFATHFVETVVPDPKLADHYYAIFAHNDRAGLGFQAIIPIKDDQDQYLEGKKAWQNSGSMISTRVFDRILRAGTGRVSIAMHSRPPLLAGFAEPGADIGHSQFERQKILTSCISRDQQFLAHVVAAYGGRCAITGPELRSGGGHPEVQAAHIRPVAEGGHDVVPNGLALTATVHWMFDRGIVSVNAANQVIITGQYRDTVLKYRLIFEGAKINLPTNERDYPAPYFTEYHRHQIFKGIA